MQREASAPRPLVVRASGDDAPEVIRSVPRGQDKAQPAATMHEPSPPPPSLVPASDLPGNGTIGEAIGDGINVGGMAPIGGMTLLEAPSLRRQAPAFARNYDLAAIGQQRVLYFYDTRNACHIYVVPEVWNLQTHDEAGRVRMNYGINYGVMDGHKPAPFMTNDPTFVPPAAHAAVPVPASTPDVPASAALEIFGILIVLAGAVALIRGRTQRRALA